MTSTAIPQSSFAPTIEDQPADFVRCVTISCAEDWHRFRESAVKTSGCEHAVVILDVQMPSPSAALLDDLAQWAQNRCSTCCVVVLLVGAVATARLSCQTLVFEQRPCLAEDLVGFFHAFLSEENIIRCDLDDLVYALGRRGLCWLSPTQIWVAGNENHWRALEADLTNGLTSDMPSHWMIVCRTPASDGKVVAPLRHLLCHLANQNKEAVVVSAVGADREAPFSVTVLRRI